MLIEQIYTGCLAQGAYYIHSEGEAVIIDPLRETAPYLEKVEKDGVKIKYIFETHFHADFVSGHVDLAEKSGATIVYGPTAKTGYAKHEAKDGEEFKVGKLTFKVLHTPGHTPESTTYLLIDENGNNHAIFTGDTLFIGDVGRPDLAIKSDLTREDLAGMLFDSLREKIMPLEDEVIVYPAHGAGSACGKNMSKETFDTLGNQKVVNYALRADMTREEFVQEVTAGIMPAPQYFAKNAKINQKGYESLDTIMERGAVPLSPKRFEEIVNSEGALMLDTRHQSEFVKGFIPNSIFIGIKGSFAPWVGTLVLDIKQPIVLIVDEGMEEEVVMRLARVGYDNTLGYLAGGIKAWQKAGKEIDHLDSIPAEEFASRLDKDACILDVRKSGEYERAHLPTAQLFPLDFINKNMDEIFPEKSYYIHCAGGYRSVIAASILRARGFGGLIDVKDGFGAIKGTELELVESTCTKG